MVFSSSVVRVPGTAGLAWVAGFGAAALAGGMAAAGDFFAGAGAVAGVGAAAGVAAGGVCARASAGRRVNSKRICNKYTVGQHLANPGLTPSFRRSLPETGCLSQGLSRGIRSRVFRDGAPLAEA